jgi:hypothetical protein
MAHFPAFGHHDGQGLNITVIGYLWQVHFGLTLCR